MGEINPTNRNQIFAYVGHLMKRDVVNPYYAFTYTVFSLHIEHIVLTCGTLEERQMSLGSSM